MSAARKIAIVGTCPSSRTLALRLPADWEVWVCSAGNENFPRVDAWFELHGDLECPWEGDRWGRYLDWLNGQTFPLWAQDLRLMPRAKRFPVERLLQRFGPYFFSSQIAWMFAFAMDQKASHIGIFGVDMAARSEFASQKPGLLHLIWLAEREGIEIVAPPESEILEPPPLYCYSFNSPMGRKLRVRQLEVEQEVAKMDAQIAELTAKRQHFRGVLDDLDWVQQTYTGGLHRPVPTLHVVDERPSLDAATAGGGGGASATTIHATGGSGGGTRPT